MEAFDAIIALMEHSNEKVRRRAGSALERFPRQVEQRADVVIEHLLHNPNPWVRLSCAIKLMSVETALVTLAYRHALEDSFDKVVQIACSEVGCRGGIANTSALIRVLGHTSWRVRLSACIALILQRAAGQSVVETLEVMSREPEARIYDAECDELDRVFQDVYRKLSETAPCEWWGKLNTILEQARNLAKS